MEGPLEGSNWKTSEKTTSEIQMRYSVDLDEDDESGEKSKQKLYFGDRTNGFLS